MDGFRKEQTGTRDLVLNQGISESGLNDLIYSPRFPPGSLIPGGGAALTALGYWMAYPNAGTPSATLSWSIPAPFWVRGTLTARILWTGDTASAATSVEWQLSASITKLGGVLAVVAGPILDVSGPAAVGTVLSTTFTAATFAVNSSHAYLGVEIKRNSAAARDNYAGEARLLSLQLLYRPAAGH